MAIVGRAPRVVFIGQGVHGVNVASGVSAAAVLHRMGRPGMLQLGRDAVEKLRRYHGTAMGATTSCECLAGKSPAKGTETCTVVETANSLALLLSASGDMAFADQAERVAMNGFGAAFFNGSMNSMKRVAARDEPLLWRNALLCNRFQLLAPKIA